MTYWAREHQRNLYRISDMLRDINAAYESTIPVLIDDLRQDDKLGTETSVSYLLAARSKFVEAQAELERARDALPKPRFASSPLPETAAEVMEREG